jgi:hypothetical protein
LERKGRMLGNEKRVGDTLVVPRFLDADDD